MNKIAQNKSKFFLAFVWLFLAATFADGANLDDLLPGFIVVHSDEDNATRPNPLPHPFGDENAGSFALSAAARSEKRRFPTDDSVKNYLRPGQRFACPAPISLADSSIPFFPTPWSNMNLRPRSFSLSPQLTLLIYFFPPNPAWHIARHDTIPNS